MALGKNVAKNLRVSGGKRGVDIIYSDIPAVLTLLREEGGGQC